MDYDAPPLSPSSSTSSLDEDDVNSRVAPNWCAYRHLLERRGVRLDTCRDVKQWYQDYWESLVRQGHRVTKDLPGYARACSMPDENELCKDVGLVGSFFHIPLSSPLFTTYVYSQTISSAAHTVRLGTKLLSRPLISIAGNTMPCDIFLVLRYEGIP